MPTKPSARITKVRRGTNLTKTVKRHRYESFSDKVAKLHSLDPLRRVRRHDALDDENDLSATTSYLSAGLKRWTDLNISKRFVAFRREAAPLCDSLPQILHFQAKIMRLLAENIAAQEPESLEPLLDLLTAFAHDLGVRFEKHYRTALELISGIAGKPQPLEVIEWTFAALAFLFKYLSKLLVPDLRPTYDVLAPLLGREKNPQFIARFAAEAMSFLVKKAAATSQRETALVILVEHVRDDLLRTQGEKQFELFQDGVMTMFAEAIKGPGQTVHSAGPAIYMALLKATPQDECELGDALVAAPWTNMLCGVLTSVIHHANLETLSDLVAAIHEETSSWIQRCTKDSPWRLVPLFRVFGVLAGVRDGSRVREWASLVRHLVEMLEATAASSPSVPQPYSMSLWSSIIFSTANIISQAPMDVLTPFITRLTQTMSKEPFVLWFIPFSAYLSELRSDKFRSLYLKPLQRFMASHWSHGENEDMLCVLLPRLAQSQSRGANGKDLINLPQDWQDRIVSYFDELEISPFPERGANDISPTTWRRVRLPKLAALLKVLQSTAVHPSTNSRIAELLSRKLKLALRPSSTLASDEVHFLVSQGFHAYLELSRGAGAVDASLRPLLLAAVPRFGRSVGFLKALLSYEREVQKMTGWSAQTSKGTNSPTEKDDSVVSSLINNLSAPSHNLRQVSLKLLELLDPPAAGSDILSLMVVVEDTPLGLDTGRTIAMNLRAISQQYPSLGESTWLWEAVPSFLFGMLTVKLASVGDSAVEALKAISAVRTGEEALCAHAFKWLEVPSQRWDGPAAIHDNTKAPRTNFDCASFQKLQSTAAEFEEAISHAVDVMRKAFDNSQETGMDHPANARSQAIKVLSAVPALAEKRSRNLVPILISWTGEVDEAADSGEDSASDKLERIWTLKDKKALLGVFAQFNNPRALFQSAQVYQALLVLLKTGDVEVQKLVLQSILQWKQSGVRPYQENLEKLLDDAMFKNELTVFMQDDEKVLSEDRAELMPILLRLLYGRIVAKKAANKGNKMTANRLAVIRNLKMDDMGSFLEIVLDNLQGIRVVDASGVKANVVDHEILAARKQAGFLNMVSAIIGELGTNVDPYVESLLNGVLYCLFFSSRKLRGKQAEAEEDDEETEKLDNESLIRTIRSTSLKCLIALFRNAATFDWNPYTQAIVDEVITPRIENLPSETTEGVSGLLQLLSTWSQLPKWALVLNINESILPKIIDCVSGPKVKENVKTYALEIVRNLIKLASADKTEVEFNELIKEELIDRNADRMLQSVASLLETQTVGAELLETCVEAVIELSDLIEKTEHIPDILRISVFLLQQPPRRVTPRVKGRLLIVLEHFLSLRNSSRDSTEPWSESDFLLYETVSSLFSYFKDRDNRSAIGRVLHVMSENDPSLTEVAHLCVSLNSYVEDRIDTPDYDRRLAAFSTISKKPDCTLTPRQWLPLLHNMIYFIKKDEEYGILSSNSADCIRRFILDAATNKDEVAAVRFELYLKTVLLPAIYSGAREESELVRREYLMVLGFLLSKLPEWPPISDLKALLTDTDEESSDPVFFFNILSPATARQMEALQLLQSANASFEFSSMNLSQFFIPMLEHFIFGRIDGADDHGLGAQATITISKLAQSLDWKHYRTIFQRYISYVESKPDHQKQLIRLLGQVADALVFATKEESLDAMDIDNSTRDNASSLRLALTVPKGDKLNSDVVDSFLPSLIKHLHEKDESEVSYRVPVGVIIVKLLKILPEDQMNLKLAGVLTDICHILRSKAMESRDMARDTLAKIALILGPSCLGFILKELRGALTRGYQLHVLSYTMHSILLTVIPEFKQGELDYCLRAIVAVIMDDVFGVTGLEKEAEGYTTQMKEIKSSKSQDSLELVAKNASVNHLLDLVQPLQALLMQKVDLKMVRKIDTLLSRISTGLLQNPAAESRDTLIFCYEVIQEVYNSQKPEAEPRIDPKLRKYLLQRGAKKSGERSHTSKHTHKLVRFALDVFRAVLKKHDSLRTATNIAGFLPIMGDAMVSENDEVRDSALKLLAVIIKVPMATPEGQDIYKLALKEATKSIAIAPSTGTELSQSALKLVSVILRERQDIAVKDAAIDMLLGKLKEDLTEPTYRHVTFNFLRCVLDRGIETAVVYDTLDHVGTIMITNEDKDTRDLARGAFFQFLRAYPMKKARWGKQIDFIVANLKYEREGGRISVMEIVHLLLMKSSSDFVQEVAATCFVPLIFVLANDESEKCQLAAGELVKEIFRKADNERMNKFLTLLRSWLEQGGNAAVTTLALQTFGFYFDVKDATEKNKADLQLVLDKADEVLGQGDIRLVEESLASSALRMIEVLLSRYPEKLLSKECQDMWLDVRRCLAHPEGAVKLKAIKLMSSYFADFAGNNKRVVPGGNLQGSHGLELSNADVQDVVRLGLGILMTKKIEEALAKEAAQILLFLVPYMPVQRDEQEESEDEEPDIEEDEDEDDQQVTKKKDLQYVFWRLSGILRKEIPPKSTAIIPKVSAMEILETLSRRLPKEHVLPSLKTILTPLQNLTDPSIAAPFSTDELFKTRHEHLRTRATIMMDGLQKRFGTTEYSRQLLEVREAVKTKREERSRKRKIEAVADPEKFGKDKIKKWEKKKDRRKTRGQEHKAQRLAYRRG